MNLYYDTSKETNENGDPNLMGYYWNPFLNVAPLNYIHIFEARPDTTIVLTINDFQFSHFNSTAYERLEIVGSNDGKHWYDLSNNGEPIVWMHKFKDGIYNDQSPMDDRGFDLNAVQMGNSQSLIETPDVIIIIGILGHFNIQKRLIGMQMIMMYHFQN